MWHLFALFVIAFAASQLLDYDYDKLDGYQQFMYVLVNIALYMVMVVVVLLVVVMFMNRAKMHSSLHSEKVMVVEYN